MSYKQIVYIRDKMHKKPFLFEKDEFIKAAQYAIGSENVKIFTHILDFFMFCFWIFYALSYIESVIFFENNIIRNLISILAFLVVSSMVSMPIEYYSKFVLDERFGFNKSTKKLYIIDSIKKLFLMLIFGVPIIYVVILFINSFTFWWLYSFLFLFAIIITINMIYPTLIAPIFNKTTPLQNDNLKDKINSLLNSVGFKSSGVFVMDASKRDSRLNAYFGGLGRSKRVVLFDTLLQKISDDELLAVLGHELGHFKHKDIYKNIAISGILLFAMFFIFGNIPPSFYSAINLDESSFSFVAIFLLLSPIISFFAMPLVGLVSRSNEYEADRMGSELGGKGNLVSALKKLVVENKSFPKSHPYYVFFYYTHPPIMQRLKALGEDIE